MLFCQYPIVIIFSFFFTSFFSPDNITLEIVINMSLSLPSPYHPLEVRLRLLEKHSPTHQMKKYYNGKPNLRRIARLKRIEEVNLLKSGHRDVMFGDDPDTMFNPVR